MKILHNWTKLKAQHFLFDNIQNEHIKLIEVQ